MSSGCQQVVHRKIANSPYGCVICNCFRSHADCPLSEGFQSQPPSRLLWRVGVSEKREALRGLSFLLQLSRSAPGGTRTHNLWLPKLMLYPVELQGHNTPDENNGAGISPPIAIDNRKTTPEVTAEVSTSKTILPRANPKISHRRCWTYNTKAIADVTNNAVITNSQSRLI